MNCINLTGRITKDLELKKSPSGLSYVRFTLAVNRVGATKEDEKRADFIRCIAWNKTAELLVKYCGKGSQIGVSGKLTETTLETDGERKTFYDVSVERVDLLGGSQRTDAAPVAPKKKIEPSLDPVDDFNAEDGLPFSLGDV